jgi:hypothetical protein
MHRTQNPTGSTVEVSPAVILRGAARYLARHDWMQGNYYPLNTASPFPPACAVGAMAMAAYGCRHESLYYTGDEQGRRDLGRAVDAFADYLSRLEPTIALTGDEAIDIDLEMSPFAWNDDPQRTKEDVILALHAAAAEYERMHGGDR